MIIDANFLENLSDDLKKIVLDASEAIMQVYKKNTFNTEIKSDGSPVTEADENANKIIIQSLNIISPDISIVSEETYEKSAETPQDPYWLVDPLDGTKEFINRSNDFTVNIALIEKGSPIYGIICAPVTGQIWSGSSFQKSVSNENIDSTLRIVMSKSHQTKTDKEFLHYLDDLEISYEIIEKGSSLKLCALSDNAADIYPRFGPTSEWDIAAGHAILSSSGGSVFKMSDSEELAYSKHDTILNPAFVAFRNEPLKDIYLPILSEFYKKLV